MTTRPRLSAPESTRLLKRDLTRAFPGVRFSVRLSRGTGYGWVHVRWTDGPSIERVESICSPWKGEGFDGMTDSTIHYQTAVGVTEDGEVIASGLRGINCSRHISEAGMEAARQKIRAEGYVASAPHLMEVAARMVAHGETVHSAAAYNRMTRLRRS